MQAVGNVFIVGAGMAGMTLGVALKRAGIACEIAEIRPHLTEPGTGISLQGPALLGEWEKNPNAPNADTVGVVARSYQVLAAGLAPTDPSTSCPAQARP